MLETKLTISGFCDEIHDYNKIQFDVLKEIGINHYDFRFINAKNPLDFSDETIDAVLDMGKEYGMTVTSIGSFIGKIKTNGDFDVHFEHFKKVIVFGFCNKLVYNVALHNDNVRATHIILSNVFD